MLCRLPTPAWQSALHHNQSVVQAARGSDARPATITVLFTDTSYAQRVGEMVFTQLWGYRGDADMIVRDEQTKITTPAVGETMTTSQKDHSAAAGLWWFAFNELGRKTKPAHHQ